MKSGARNKAPKTFEAGQLGSHRILIMLSKAVLTFLSFLGD
jgi:hypothetical protein